MEYTEEKTDMEALNQALAGGTPVECRGPSSELQILSNTQLCKSTLNIPNVDFDIIKKMSEDHQCKGVTNLDSKQTDLEQHYSKDLEDMNPDAEEGDLLKTDIFPAEVTGVKRKFEIDDDYLRDLRRKSCSPQSADEKKIANLRKNIRDVMGENQLDSNTLVAQREESERLARVAEQQKIIREYQRQTAVNKQNVRTHNRVLSLLQSGNTFAKIADLTDDNLPTTKCKSPIETEEFPDAVTILKKTEIEIPKIDSKIRSNSDLNRSTLPVSDIVTIEDSSSEDDCILLSDEEEEELEPEVEDDPHNSGLHVKDAYNVPDEQGRVVVNVGHPEGEDDIFLAPQLSKCIKPHQIGGVRFLFDNIIESTKRFNSSTGFGCILAHSMGLGKTLQVVCFCDIFLRHTDSKTVLCVMPINTLQNWVSEFNKWIPMESDNPDQVRPRPFKVFVLNDQQKTLNARAKVILKWVEEGGVLLMGYELFRLLALKLIPNRKRRIGKNFIVGEKVETEAHRRLSESIYQALVKPGPDLVICDEGHRIKNSHAGISLALKQIRTRRRIVLTGYPLQNNLIEYWCMVDFVRPNYLGTRTEFSNMFERPIQNGQCIDSTPEDIKLMRYRAHVLHSLLVGFVQRRSHMVLQQSLPRKLEYVILTKMNDFQRKLYDTFMNDVVRKKAVPNPLKAFAVCCKIWNHPDVLYNFIKKRETDLDLEIDDADVTADGTTSLKDNLSKTENAIISSDFVGNSEATNLIKEPPEDQCKPYVEPKIEGSDLRTKYESFAKGHFMAEGDKSTSNVPNKIMENTMTDPSSNNPRNNKEEVNYNFQNDNTENFFTECKGEPYWNDSNINYYGYQGLCDNIGPPVRPDYVGMVIKQTPRELENVNSSSQIVDLDTKEIKIVETDIDVTINRMVGNNSITSERASSVRGKYEEAVELPPSDPSKASLYKSSTPSINSDSSKSLCSSGPFEKEPVKGKHEEVIPYDWAADIMKGYEPNLVRNSPKMEIFFCILNESIRQGDRVLLFSQSLLTLNLIEAFLQSNLVPESNEYWGKNSTYFRLDGSTTSQEREKLINDFNSNSHILLFLISTKAGSLGINLVGANRVIVFDASWNPCHDTQAVYRIYRYGQQKPCFVYRIVMDKCLEKKIYDRQVKKQGMSDRVVDECNPDAHLSMKDVTNLCYDYDTDLKSMEFEKPIDSYSDIIIQKIIEKNKEALSKEPFHHESLLIDRKEKKLSLAEKRQAQRGYELEKKASTKQIFNCQGNKMQYKIIRNDGTVVTRPVASVRPMQTIKTQNTFKNSGVRTTRWIPAEVWQRQGMTAQEMTLPLDVVIPTNSNDKTNIILKSGQRVMVLKSPKGIYMQLESGKIIAIRTSSKVSPSNKCQKDTVIDITSENNKPTKPIPSQTPRSQFEYKSTENSTVNSPAVKESPNKTNMPNSATVPDVVLINEEKITEKPSSFNEEIYPKQFKNTVTHNKANVSADFGAKIPAMARKIRSDSGVSILGPTHAMENKLKNQTNIFKTKTSSSKFYTEKTKKVPEMEITDLPPHREVSAVESFAKKTMSSPKVNKPLYCPPALESKSVSNVSVSALEKPDYALNTTAEYDVRTDSQLSSPGLQNLSQLNKAQQQQQQQQNCHLPSVSVTQQHQDQRESYVPYNMQQHANYVDKVQQQVVVNPATKPFPANLESAHHSDYYDTMYDSGYVSSYDYPHRYSNYSSHNSYVNLESHYHPHYHNFSNTQVNPITTHPYYMHWPTMSTVTQNNNQHNLSPPFSQNGPSVNQWHNQR